MLTPLRAVLLVLSSPIWLPGMLVILAGTGIILVGGIMVVPFDLLADEEDE